jgi:cytochrome b561
MAFGFCNPSWDCCIRAHGARVKVFLLFRLPPFMERNHDLAEKLLVAHTIVAHLLFILIALHASAALFHHFIRRDETLSGWLWHRQATGDSPRFVL